jgi:hypothetical protein
MAIELVVGEPTRAELGLHPRAPVEWGRSEYVQVIAGDAPRYDGPYEVTPSAEAQTLDTSGLVMTDSVTVNPIPSNYGLITWNGATLTVS